MCRIENNRNSNIELLRIISMLMIVGYHLAYYGVWKEQIWMEGAELNRWVICMLFPGGQVGVAAFFIISGYFLVDKVAISLKRIICELFFYGALSTAIMICYLLIQRKTFGMARLELINTIVHFLIDPYLSTWWFPTTYIVLLLMAPVINSVLRRLNSRGMTVVFLYCWIVIFGLATDETLFYELHKALMFYVAGAFIRKADVPKVLKHRWVIISIAVSTWMMCSAVRYYVMVNGAADSAGRSYMENMITSLISDLSWVVLTPLCAISLFLLLRSFKISDKRVNAVAATTFGVYLLHDAPYIRYVIWKELLKIDTVYMRKYFLFIAVTDIIVIFACCALIDIARVIYIEPQMFQIINEKTGIFRNRYYKKE